MTIKTLRILFPGLSKKEIEFALKYVENPFKSFLALIIVLVWRAQISYSQSLYGKNKRELLSIPSMKYTSKLLSSNSDIQSIIAAVVLFRTSADELRFSDFISMSINERDSFISSKIYELKNSSGSAKILTPNQISSSEDLLMHRRGLFFHVKSVFQSLPVFDSGSLISGSNILYIGKFQVIQIIADLFQQEVSDSIYWLKDFYLKSSLYKADHCFPKSVDELVNCFILEFLFEGSKTLNFQDGILVSEDEDNLLPIEKGLFIQRNKPALFSADIYFDPGNDLFLKAAFSQLNKIKEDRKIYKISSSRLRKKK